MAEAEPLAEGARRAGEQRTAESGAGRESWHAGVCTTCRGRAIHHPPLRNTPRSGADPDGRSGAESIDKQWDNNGSEGAFREKGLPESSDKQGK